MCCSEDSRVGPKRRNFMFILAEGFLRLVTGMVLQSHAIHITKQKRIAFVLTLLPWQSANDYTVLPRKHA